MALTLVNAVGFAYQINIGSLNAKAYQYQGDASYPAGGYPLTKTTFGVMKLVAVLPEGAAFDYATSALNSYMPFWDWQNGTLRFFEMGPTTPVTTANAPLSEVATGASLATVKGQLLVLFF